MPKKFPDPTGTGISNNLRIHEDLINHTKPQKKFFLLVNRKYQLRQFEIQKLCMSKYPTYEGDKFYPLYISYINSTLYLK